MERGSALLALPFPAALFVGSVEESGTDNVPVRSFSQFETRASEIATGVQRRFAARVDHGPVGFSFRASDPGHLSVRDRFLAEHFQAQGGTYFCEPKNGGRSLYCQIKGLKLEGPFPLALSADESALGISTKLYYDFTAGAFRLSNDGRSWGDWASGLPPSLTRLELIRHELEWSVAFTPTSPFPGRPSDYNESPCSHAPCCGHGLRRSRRLFHDSGQGYDCGNPDTASDREDPKSGRRKTPRSEMAQAE